MQRIVVFGATDYQGSLAAKAMVARGLRPTLAGCNEAYLNALSVELGGLSYEPADACDISSIRRLLSPGDVLVSTAGPFSDVGETILRAAIDQGSHYVDCCGEGLVLRTIQERFRDAIEAAGITALSACAYDFFPGNLAASHVLAEAGPEAVRVEIGYVGNTAPGYPMSLGSFASDPTAVLGHGLFFRDGYLVPEALGKRVGRINLDGAEHTGLSVGGTESFFLPELYPSLRAIDSYWCWGGERSVAKRAALRVTAAFGRKRSHSTDPDEPVGATEDDGLGPTRNQRERSSSYVVATAFDGGGIALASAVFGDADRFTFTANILAWTAEQLFEGRAQRTGWTGPVQAFGLPSLIAGHEQCGMGLLSFDGPDRVEVPTLDQRSSESPLILKELVE